MTRSRSPSDVRRVHLYDIPDDVEPDGVERVGNTVARMQTTFRPRNLGVSAEQVRREPLDSLADDNDLEEDRRPGFPVCVEGHAGKAASVVDRAPAVIASRMMTSVLRSRLIDQHREN